MAEEAAELQKEAWPDIEPLIVPVSTRAAFDATWLQTDFKLAAAVVATPVLWKWAALWTALAGWRRARCRAG
jgi:hypothetical protein